MSKRSWCVALLSMIALVGCSGGGGVPKVGNYAAGDESLTKPRAAVTEFKVEADAKEMVGNRGHVAADQLSELLAKTQRFQVVGRVAFRDALEKANLADTIKPGTLVKPGPIPGVDYVFFGTVSKLSISKKVAAKGIVDKTKNLFKDAGAASRVMVTATCRINLSMRDPVTGDFVVTNDSEFQSTGTAKSLGLDILESSANAPEGTEIPVNEDDREKVMQYAIDDAVRRSLPKIDRYLLSKYAGQSAAVEAAPTAPTAPASPGLPTAPANSTAPAAGGATTPGVVAAPAQPQTPQLKKCKSCSAVNATSATFCRQCGAKLD